MPTNKKTNRLIAEKSPYLLQHAHNPVDWYPWGNEAFKKAKQENKPLFVSIGYSTCHWCHVMERESFEDEIVAALLNERFISIKVDREERPDIDSIYMNVCQMMNGHGGWPLSIFMTPEKVPFYAGTYFPKEARFGYPRFKDVIVGLSNKFKENPDHIKEVTGSVLQALKPNTKKKSSAQVSMKAVERGFSHYIDTFDPRYGGFGQAPKFPMPHSLTFLLRYYVYSKDEDALNMVVRTLTGLARGGIYDHVGYGFSRYSTDEKFLVPHFEKMLYDNALLAIAYLETFQVTKNEPFKIAAEEIFTYVLRDMQHHEGGFYSAEDADSEGEEGKFYVWTPSEIRLVLGDDLGSLFCHVYDITESGNFEGKNIPNLIKIDLDQFAAQNGQDLTQLAQKLELARGKLFEHREKRIHPYKDDKILTSWNGLMIAALAKGGRALASQDYILAAKKAIEFIDHHLFKNGRLMVRYREGEVRNKGFIDDYAFLLWAYIEMYESTLELDYIERAKNLTKEMVDLFWDEEEGGFFFYGSDNEELLIRQKEAYDGAIPSGNSVAAMQMLRLARLTGEYQLEEKVQRLFDANAKQLTQYPEGHAFLLQTYLMTQMGMKEVIVLKSKNDKIAQSLIKELQTGFHPEVTFLVSEDQEKLATVAPYTKDYHPIDQSTTVYVCENFICNKPTTDINEAIELINKKK
ncbi:thioredoxin domain-containing protein [Bacillus sp. EB600]|uniref:thioredoxin domain-containing protein n=1 Tax=Bacillus sp. EB600 TaxID=2806345 RepID=UPI00210F1713|nr:thioredoxin domain-containing protein [Bacillus sp. EB600]MCQ6280567.1 thioredoxin domain-containing protein [Bacillus sp. EB600]